MANIDFGADRTQPVRGIFDGIVRRISIPNNIGVAHPPSGMAWGEMPDGQLDRHDEHALGAHTGRDDVACVTWGAPHPASSLRKQGPNRVMALGLGRSTTFPRNACPKNRHLGFYGFPDARGRAEADLLASPCVRRRSCALILCAAALRYWITTASGRRRGS